MNVEAISIIVGMCVNFGAIALMIRKTGEWMGRVGAELEAIHNVLSEIKDEAVKSRDRLDGVVERLSNLEGRVGSAA